MKRKEDEAERGNQVLPSVPLRGDCHSESSKGGAVWWEREDSREKWALLCFSILSRSLWPYDRARDEELEVTTISHEAKVKEQERAEEITVSKKKNYRRAQPTYGYALSLVHSTHIKDNDIEQHNNMQVMQ